MCVSNVFPFHFISNRCERDERRLNFVFAFLLGCIQRIGDFNCTFQAMKFDQILTIKKGWCANMRVRKRLCSRIKSQRKILNCNRKTILTFFCEPNIRESLVTFVLCVKKAHVLQPPSQPLAAFNLHIFMCAAFLITHKQHLNLQWDFYFNILWNAKWNEIVNKIWLVRHLHLFCCFSNSIELWVLHISDINSEFQPTYFDMVAFAYSGTAKWSL